MILWNPVLLPLLDEGQEYNPDPQYWKQYTEVEPVAPTPANQEQPDAAKTPKGDPSEEEMPPGLEDWQTTILHIARWLPVYPVDPETGVPLCKWRGQPGIEYDPLGEHRGYTRFACCPGDRNYWNDEAPQGYVVIDMDMKGGKDGKKWAQKAWELYKTPSQPSDKNGLIKSPGGFHLWFRVPKILTNKIKGGERLPGLEIKYDRHLVTIPGSRKPSGEYKPITPPFNLLELPELPLLFWLGLKKLGAEKVVEKRLKDPWPPRGEGYQNQGARNNKTNPIRRNPMGTNEGRGRKLTLEECRQKAAANGYPDGKGSNNSHMASMGRLCYLNGHTAEECINFMSGYIQGLGNP